MSRFNKKNIYEDELDGCTMKHYEEKHYNKYYDDCNEHEEDCDKKDCDKKDCCNKGCNKECSPEYKKNDCKDECCIKHNQNIPADICNAKGMVILAEMLYDRLNLQYEQGFFDAGQTFTIDQDPTCFTEGDPICIESINVEYGIIGTDSPTIAPTIGDDSSTTFMALMMIDCSLPVYNNYAAMIESKDSCCNKKDKSQTYKFIQSGSTFLVCGLIFKIKGTIGCKKFTASYEKAVDGLDLQSTYNVNPVFYGSLCLPSERKTLNAEMKFEGKIDANCITTEETYVKPATGSPAEFMANIVGTVKINAKITFTTKEEVVVLAVPQGTLDDNLNCNNKCR
ncbi:MAG: hypothetical protein ACRDD7_00200 [Peptostreptococcaceae bacterium]